MRKIDAFILLMGMLGAITWFILSSKDGYKANNATMVARSISISSTIDGKVENDPPLVGKRVRSNDLLVRIQDGRFDRSRLAGLDGQIAFLTAEIENVERQQIELKSQLGGFRQRANSYNSWMLKAVALQTEENVAALEITRKRQALAAAEVKRTSSLYKKRLASKAAMQTAKTEAQVAQNQVKLNAAQLERNKLMLDTLKRDGVFFDSGDTSYWAKMVDTIQVRIFDNASKVSSLKTQLTQAELQANIERERINSSYAEEHRAPFSGTINAAFVKRGTRVTTGTNLYQLLDCTQPVIIIPIPDNRISEFSVGLRVTVYPTDTEQALPGSISYVTSGTLIGADTSIQVQQDLILKGNRAIVTLDNTRSFSELPQSCETERKAIVVIHTKSWYDTVASWATTTLSEFAWWDLTNTAASAIPKQANL